MVKVSPAFHLNGTISVSNHFRSHVIPYLSFFLFSQRTFIFNVFFSDVTTPPVHCLSTNREPQHHLSAPAPPHPLPPPQHLSTGSAETCRHRPPLSTALTASASDIWLVSIYIYHFFPPFAHVFFFFLGRADSFTRKSTTYYVEWQCIPTEKLFVFYDDVVIRMVLFINISVLIHNLRETYFF